MGFWLFQAILATCVEPFCILLRNSMIAQWRKKPWRGLACNKYSKAGLHVTIIVLNTIKLSTIYLK